MAMTGRTVIGVFDEAANADRAIDALQTAGFSSSQIHHSGRGAANTGGGFLSGVKNFFTGDDTATTGGHVAEDLTGMGVSSDEASYYDNEYKSGRTVISIDAGDRAEEAKTILDTNGAYNYSRQRGTAATTGYTSTAATTNTNEYDRTRDASYTDATTTNTTDRTRDAGYANETEQQRVLRLREEQLNVSKQKVQAGEVSLGKNVVSEQKTVNVPVTREEVYVERRDVTSGMADDASPIGEGESIRVPVSEERVNVSKDTVVTGEVSIGKRAVEETQQVTDTVRREEARLDQTGNPNVQGNVVRGDTDINNRTDRTDTTNSY